MYGSSSFPGSGGTTATTQNKTEKSDGEFPEAFEAEDDGDKTNEESITLYPTSPQRSGSLLEVTDHLGKFSILILICYIYTNLYFLSNILYVICICLFLYWIFSEIDRFDTRLGICPLLQDSSAYNADTVDLTRDSDARSYWLKCFEDSLSKFADRAVGSQEHSCGT